MRRALAASGLAFALAVAMPLEDLAPGCGGGYPERQLALEGLLP